MEPVRNLLQRGQVGALPAALLIWLWSLCSTRVREDPPDASTLVTRACYLAAGLRFDPSLSRAATFRPSAWASTRSGASWSAWWTSARQAGGVCPSQLTSGMLGVHASVSSCCTQLFPDGLGCLP